MFLLGWQKQFIALTVLLLCISFTHRIVVNSGLIELTTQINAPAVTAQIPI